MNLRRLVGIAEFFGLGNKPEFGSLLIYPLFVRLPSANLPFDFIVEQDLSFF